MQMSYVTSLRYGRSSDRADNIAHADIFTLRDGRQRGKVCVQAHKPATMVDGYRSAVEIVAVNTLNGAGRRRYDRRADFRGDVDRSVCAPVCHRPVIDQLRYTVGK